MRKNTRHRGTRLKGRAVTLSLGLTILFLSSFALIPSWSPAPVRAPISPFSWNPRVTCIPIVVRITDITANYTGSASFSTSRFSPGTTPPVSGGDAKRWLTPGSTPAGWAAPGPPCTVTNSKGTTSLFVEIDGVKRSSLTNEDWSNLYDPANGGNSHSTLTGDTTFNLFDPAVVPNYSSSCASAADSTCYGRIHGEIDHDWKAAGYCGTGTVCDNSTLATQTSSDSTLIDIQGFVYWDAGTLNANWHQFSGWELHPLTAWKLSSAPPPVPFTVSVSSSSPQVGQPVSFSAVPSNGTVASSFSWDFGDGVTVSGSSLSHIFVAAGSFTVYVTMVDNHGKSFTTFITINAGSWNPAASCVPTLTTLEGIVGNVSIHRVSSDPLSIGADYSGGGFRLDGNLPYGSNPATWPFFKRDIRIPCSVNGTPTFVEFHNVTVVNKSREDCTTTYSSDNGGGSYPHGWQSCDVTFTLATPGYGDDSCPACYMHRLYAGIDRDWNASGQAPPIPIEGQRIDIQGFIYWNNANVNATFHSYTGWELHPVTAWQLTHLPVVAGISVVPSNPTSAQSVNFTGTASGGTGPYTFNWDFGDGTVSTGSSPTHTYSPGNYSVHMAAVDSQGSVGTAVRILTVRIPPDFTLTLSPSSVTFPSGSTSISINVTSHYGFSGIVSLGVLASPGITGSFLPASLTLSSGAYAVSTLTLSSVSPGSYNVSVSASSGSLLHTKTVAVTVVDVGPTVGISESTNAAFRDATITMTISSSDIDGTVTSLRVNWGDGIVDNLPSNATADNHAYVHAGSFAVNVTVTDNAGLTSSATGINTISDAPPTALFAQSFTSAPTGTPINFNSVGSSDSDGAIVDYSWNFGDGFTANGPIANHSYKLAGNYVVTLTVTDNATLTASTSSSIKITDRPPMVGINLSPTNSPTGTPIVLSFNATDPDGTITNTTVIWGDGTVDKLAANATLDRHSYSLAGSYGVYVNATDNHGLVTTSTITSLTITDRPPVVSFTESNGNTPTGTPLSLTINTTDPDGNVSSIRVVWGDGTIDSLPGTTLSDSHVYSSAGFYNVYVNATDNANLTGKSGVSVVTVTDRPPTVSFTVSTSTAPTGATISGTITASDPDGTVNSLVVSWGDGTVDTLPSGATSDSHVYAAAGTFIVYVNATDDKGLGTQSGGVTVSVIDRVPVAVLTASSSTNLTMTGFSFTATGSFDPDGTIVGYAWSFGDGATASGFAVNHSYADEGNYTVVLTVTDNSGSIGAASFVVTVLNRAPTAAFSQSPASPLTGQTVGFDGSSSSDPDGTVSSYTWNFGDGATATGTSVIHAYSSNGTYIVHLTVLDDDGAASNSTVLVVVGPDPAPTWTSGASFRPIRIDAHAVLLTWSGAVDQVQVSSYALYVNGSLVVTVPGSLSSYTIAGLTPLQNYTFRVEAGNPSGNYSTNGPSTKAFTRLQGDVNLDCQVDIVDLAMVGSRFGSSLGDVKYDPRVDLNGDGIIDIVDLAIVGSNFGRSC